MENIAARNRAIKKTLERASRGNGMSGTLAILNVGAGDTKLTFDRHNPAERIRAARIVKDMMRRGYALLVEVKQPDGSMAFQRALDFDESAAEYIIADFDPTHGRLEAQFKMIQPQDETTYEKAGETQTGDPPTGGTETPASTKRRGRPRRIPAEGARAVAVSRTAGG